MFPEEDGNKQQIETASPRVAVYDARGQKQMPAIAHMDRQVEQDSLGVITQDTGTGKYDKDTHFFGIISREECPPTGRISTNCINSRYLNLRVHHEQKTDWYILSPEYPYTVNGRRIKFGKFEE